MTPDNDVITQHKDDNEIVMQMLRQIWDAEETDACAWKVSFNQMLKNIVILKDPKTVNTVFTRISAAFE